MYEHLGHGALDYKPCRYGDSKLLFRGPRKQLNGPYCAILGGAEVYGKFISTPFPERLENALDVPVVNFGCVNAGLDVYLNDPTILKLCAKAKVTVVQTLGPQNASNPFYRVHPRRNDRFVGATDRLLDLFPKLDFTEFSFTGHLLRGLRRASRRKYEMVVKVLQDQWVTQMHLLAASIPTKTLMLHLCPPARLKRRSAEQSLVTEDMITSVRASFSHCQAVDLGKATVAPSVKGKVFSELEKPAAVMSPGPLAHDAIADLLEDPLRRLLA